MNRRLFIDSLRRNLGSLATMSGVAAMLWLAAGAGLVSTGRAVATSMTLALLAGPGLAIRLVAPREILALPISQQEIWRTRFWFGTAAVVVATTVGKIVGLGISIGFAQPAPGVETIVLSSLLDVAFAAAFTVIVFFAPTQGGWAMWISVAVFLPSPFIPHVMADRLPVMFGQLTPASLAVMSLGAATGLVAYLRTPVIVTAHGQSTYREALKGKGRGWFPEFAGVTGLSRLQLTALVQTLTIQATTLLFLPFFLMIIAALSGEGQTWRDAASEFGLLPSEGRPNMYLWFWILIFSRADWPLRMVRHLRTLPLSTRALNASFLSSSINTWLMGWMLLGLLNFVLGGQLTNVWRWPVFLTCIGYDCLYRSLQLRWRNPWWLFGTLLLCVLPVAIITSRSGSLRDPILMIAGPVFILVAAWLNHNTLTKGRDAYARTPQRAAFGVEGAN